MMNDSAQQSIKMAGCPTNDTLLLLLSQSIFL